jgi:intracellular multiplication protein IcmE
MAGKKENIKALFSNTRSRIIILFTLILIVMTVVIGIIKFTGGTSSSPLSSSANVKQTPQGIESIPGALNQTAQYAALQEEQNVEQAQTARKSGSSAIPTIIRSQVFGEGVQPIGAKAGEGGLGFQSLAQEDLAGAQRSLWLQSLQDTNCSKVTLSKAIEQGANIIDLKGACSCLQLKDNGYQLTELMTVCKCSELKDAGFAIKQLKEAGFTASQLRICGFVACDEHGAGFSAQEMKDAGYSDGELKGAGFSERDIARAGGIPDGYTPDDIRKAGCDPAAITKLRNAGVTAAAIRRINGCSAAQLKAAGFSAQDLKNAGFSAADLKNAGFSPAELKQAGYSARDLLNAGFTTDDLANAGFSPAEIKAAGNILPPGMTPDAIKASGCDVASLKRQRLAGVSATLIRKYAGCNAQALKAAGFTQNDLTNAGFSPAEINAVGPIGSDSAITSAGCDPVKLKVLMQQGVSAKRIHELNGCSAEVLKNAGFDAKDLLAAGFSPQDLLAAGFKPNQISGAQISDDAIHASGCDPAKLRALMTQGVSAKRIRALNGCSLQALKNAGFDAKAIANAGFTPKEMLAAGFTPDEVRAAQAIDENAIRAAGCDPEKLKVMLARGVTAKQIRTLNGCSADVLKQAGFDARSLAEAGFTPAELAAAGFSPEQLAAAALLSGSKVTDNTIRTAGCDPVQLRKLLQQGVTAKRIHDLNGCSIDALKAAGFDAKGLADAGFTPAQLLAAGFTPADLAKAGLNPSGVIAAGRTADCSPASLQAARAMGVSAATIKQTLGCSAQAMKAAGFSAQDLKNAGFTAADLKNAGFSAAELKAAGFSAKDLYAAGFSADALKNAGFSARDLIDAGFSPAELKAAGFSAAELKKAGLTAAQLKAAGFSAAELLKAGVSAKDLKDAGFTAEQLKSAGLSNQELQAAGFSSQDSALAGLNAISAPPPPPSTLATIPSIGGGVSPASKASAEAANAKQLQEIMNKQQKQIAEQRYQQKIQQRTSVMTAAANQALQGWKTISSQQYIATSYKEKPASSAVVAGAQPGAVMGISSTETITTTTANKGAIIKTGDIIFAVIDTSVNSDEPGPILATVVSGSLKGSRLIGSFNLPNNADKMVITFNTLSVPGAAKTVSISAFAIDPNTARTALSSQTDHHYLQRYGSLFAATFLEGFGNAFQSANTTITVGGTGGTTDTTVSNGIGRSTLENAVIGLATLGKAWGQVAMQNMSRPTTVEVYSGTGVGVLFTQDLRSL